MKRKFTVLLIGLAMAVTAFAQGGAPKSDLPTADQILDKYVQAIGGKAVIEKQTSRYSKGTLEIPAFGASGTAEVYEKAPNKTITIVNIPGFGIINDCFDGTIGWAQDPQNGMRDKSGPELAASKLDAEFYKPIKIKELYPKVVVKGKDKVGDKDVYVLEATPNGGPTETWYFDAQSGLLLRQDAEREGPQGKQVVQVFFEDYRVADGIKVAYVLKQVTPAFTLNIKLDEVKHNVPIDDAKFKKPSQ